MPTVATGRSGGTSRWALRHDSLGLQATEKDGRICHREYRPLFDGIFNVPELEYGHRAADGIRTRDPHLLLRCQMYP